MGGQNTQLCNNICIIRWKSDIKCENVGRKMQLIILAIAKSTTTPKRTQTTLYQ